MGTPGKNLSIQIQLPASLFCLLAGIHLTVFTTRKFTTSHLQMSQVHRLFNKHIRPTCTENPHKFQNHQVQKKRGPNLTFVSTQEKKGLLNQSILCARLRKEGIQAA